MIDPQVLTFAGAVFLLTLTPGADTMLVMKNVLARGWQAGILTTMGISAGLFGHALLSSLGLSLILMRSAAAFEIVKWIGAGYLVFLGVQSIIKRSKSPSHLPDDQPEEGKTKRQGRTSRSFLEGLLTNLLNPKVAVFYLAFLPQFINPGDSVVFKSILLASIHVAMGIIWLSLVIFLLKSIRSVITRPSIQRALDTTAGMVLIALGLRLVVERR